MDKGGAWTFEALVQMDYEYQDPQADFAKRLRVALMDSNKEFGQTVVRWLHEANHSCHWKTTGSEFIRLVSQESFDVLVLATAGGDRSGEEVLNWVRSTLALATPTLFLVDAKERASIPWLLHRGADDCSTKPLERYEFLMRLVALTRRGQHRQGAALLEVGNLRIDHDRQKVFVSDVEVALTRKEFRLISFILRNLGRTLSRGAIFESVWGLPVRRDMRTLNTHMSQVRSKLNLVPAAGWNLISTYGHGYRLEYIGRGEAPAQIGAAPASAGHGDVRAAANPLREREFAQAGMAAPEMVETADR